MLVSGIDIENTPQQTSRTSVPGASWVFSRDDLRQGLFATRMNGAPLAREHGSPIRLIVPGWYGCACIKWVNRIELVDDAAPATTQMMEFAQRTHQASRFERASDYLPATIDTAAVPIRVERWEVAGKTEYRIIGIIWGGQTPTNAFGDPLQAFGAVDARRQLPDAHDDVDVEPLDAHLAAHRARTLRDRLEGYRPGDSNAAARSVLLRTNRDD